MDAKGHSDEVSDEREEHVIAQWRKGHVRYKVTKNLAKSCSYSRVLWKPDLARDEAA